MNFKVKRIGLESGGKPIVVLNREDAESMGVRSLGRVKLSYNLRERVAIVNTATELLSRGEIFLYEEVYKYLGAPDGGLIEVEPVGFPRSTEYIRNKLRGRQLDSNEIREIVKDVVNGALSEVEITSFVIALAKEGLDLDEAVSLTNAMVETGDTLVLDKEVIVDKHSIGGVPGDKTTLLVVPIVAAAGLCIPKSSSRAITSAAGSAERAETLMNVELSVDEMRRVVEKTNGCIVWGGAIHLAPADDIFVQVEYPLSIDPLLLPSIMSKKKAVGANHLVIDIPTGRGTKIKTIGDASLLSKDFIELGKRLNIRTQCAITYGEQPIGHAVGPALEAKEALEVLSRRKVVPDLIDKATHLAGILFEMCGLEAGQKRATEILASGMAEKKLREIIAEQGGNSNVKPEDIAIGSHHTNVLSSNGGYVLWIDTAKLVEVARVAGSPRDKGAGIILNKKLGSRVKQGESLFTIYAESSVKLQRAEKMLEGLKIVAVGDKMEMLLDKIEDRPRHEKTFILER
ncbi:MAG: AMP phosphorylase [Candidatus Bathyarchaeia archaeon]